MVLIFFQLLKRQRLKKNWWQLEKQAWITTMNMLLGQYNKSIYVNTYSWQNELSFLWLFIVEMHFMIFIPLWMKKWGRKFRVLHCFTGTKKEALEGIQRGFYVSFSGIITFSKSSALQEVVRALPLEKMLIETDSPYLAPLPYRGKKNEPSYVVETAKMLAQLKNVSLDEVALQTS